MAITPLKAQRIVSAGLGVLQRELTLPNLVWKDAAGDFAGALNDTISIRVPAYVTARSRTLRSGSARTRDGITERKVDVTLDTDVYKDVTISDEELSLDIASFGEQVLNPIVRGVATKLEDVLAAKIQGATYHNSITYDYSADDPYAVVAVAARRKLNEARVPAGQRALVVGSGIEAALLTSDKFIRADYMGNGSAMQEAQIGRVAGFDVYTSPALGPDEGYAFHKSAFVMSQRAPLVPAGAPFGASQSYQGLAMRMVRVLDSATITEVLATDAWIGTNVVTDEGWYDGNGMFNASEGTVGSAVTLATSAAADDIIDTSGSHGLVAGDLVVFPTLTGGTGLTAGRGYYVIAANLAATTFQVSTTPGGAAVNFTADITAGTVRKNGAPLLVRAVKVNAVP